MRESMEDKILQYLDNELSDNERLEFQKALETDPALKKEFDEICQLRSAFSVKLIKDIAWDDMIEDYLNNSMSDEEKEWFENRLEKDEKLRSDLELHSLLMSSFITKKIASMSAEESEQQPDNQSSEQLPTSSEKDDQHGVQLPPDAPRKNIWISMVAAAACVILVACGSVNYYNSSLANNSLNEMVTFCKQTVPKGMGPDDVSDALEMYAKGDVEGALKILNGVTKDDYTYSDAMYIKGMILLKDKWFSKEAVQCLKESGNPRAQELLDDIWFKFLY